MIISCIKSKEYSGIYSIRLGLIMCLLLFASPTNLLENPLILWSNKMCRNSFRCFLIDYRWELKSTPSRDWSITFIMANTSTCSTAMNVNKPRKYNKIFTPSHYRWKIQKPCPNLSIDSFLESWLTIIIVIFARKKLTFLKRQGLAKLLKFWPSTCRGSCLIWILSSMKRSQTNMNFQLNSTFILFLQSIMNDSSKMMQPSPKSIQTINMNSLA